MIRIHAFLSKDEAWDFGKEVVSAGGTVLDYGMLTFTDYYITREGYYIKYDDGLEDKNGKS